MLRPDPLASSPLSLSRIAGRLKRSATREATMPTTPSCQSADERTSAGGGGSGTMAHAAAKMPASSSCRSRLSSSSLSASGSAVVAVGAAQQLERQRGVLEPAGGVEPRREAEPDHARVDGAGCDAGDLEERGQPRPRSAAQAAEADADERAVLAGERDDVGDGADGDDVGERPQLQRHLDAWRPRRGGR